MLRITETVGDTGMARFKVEGRLTGASVSELAAVCRTALENGEPPAIDLAGVSYADAGGAATLSRLQDQGAVLLGASGFVLELIEGPRCGVEPSSDDEASLVERLRRGDSDAYEVIVRRFGSRSYRLPSQ